MNEKQYHLVKVIQKIEIFRGFDADDVQRLLRVCRFRSFAEGDRIYRRGETSDEMLILLKGKLRVLGESGEELAQILPGMPIGEMGLFTGLPRSADIDAVTGGTAIALRRSEIAVVLSGNREMQVKVLQNVILTLSARLSDSNRMAESQSRIIRDLQRRLSLLEGGGIEVEKTDGDDEEWAEEVASR